MNLGVLLVLASGAAMAVVGIALVVASLLSASRRGQSTGSGLWAPREMFVGKELMQNRGGFLLAVAGIVVMLPGLYWLAY